MPNLAGVRGEQNGLSLARLSLVSLHPKQLSRDPASARIEGERREVHGAIGGLIQKGREYKLGSDR